MAATGQLEIRIVGHARTPWRRREDAPHQPGAAPDAEGVLEILPEFAPGLADLDSLGRIWIVALLDRSSGFALKVKPPRGGPKRGVFATRSPHRPSQIALSNAAIESVDVVRGIVRVRGVDLLDGTPILDLKPYFPVFDTAPNARVPEWVDRLMAGYF